MVMPEFTVEEARVQRLVADYDRRLRLARATDLAKSGRFLEAEGILNSSGGIPEGGGELDLLARIAVRQRRYGKALLLWEGAMRCDPNNEEYRRCVEKLRERVANLKRWARFARKGLLFLIGVVVLALGRSIIHRHYAARAVPPAHHDGGVKAQKSP
jgi:hypothetical protein